MRNLLDFVTIEEVAQCVSLGVLTSELAAVILSEGVLEDKVAEMVALVNRIPDDPSSNIMLRTKIKGWLLGIRRGEGRMDFFFRMAQRDIELLPPGDIQALLLAKLDELRFELGAVQTA